MKIKIWMIRHGMTAGNLERRYVGITDEPLCEQGYQQILERRFEHQIETVYVSPMRRCRETAKILFPKARQIGVDAFRECSFGEFEYRNYHELNGHPDYQKWIDSGGVIGFPGGEDQKTFCDRVQSAFEIWVSDEILQKMQQNASNRLQTMAMVVHGGTIMAIMSRWAVPHEDYFHWQVANGSGYIVCLDTDAWQAGDQYLTVLEKF